MSCYFRHIKAILDGTEIEVTEENRKDIDRAFHRIAGVSYKDCSATWKQLKREPAGNEQKRQELVRKLRNALR